MQDPSNPPSEPPPYSVCWLRRALLAGAAVDLVGAVGFFFFADRVERDLQLPSQLSFWPKYAAVFLVVLAILYCVSAINPARSIANVGVAISGRTLGALFYIGWCLHIVGIQWNLLAFAVANLVFAIVYWCILGPAGRAELCDSLRPSASG